eukprot:4025836-Pyramimonas_sp.AAC.1
MMVGASLGTAGAWDVAGRRSPRGQLSVRARPDTAELCAVVRREPAQVEPIEPAPPRRVSVPYLPPCERDACPPIQCRDSLVKWSGDPRRRGNT